MPITRKAIKDLLKAQRYGDVVVSDLRRFEKFVATKDGKPNTKGQASIERYAEWNKNLIRHQPLLVPPNTTANFFLNHAKTFNRQTPKVAECSNFACHAVAVLLDDPKIRAEYNVVLAGTMGGEHNIAVLVPIAADIPTKLPKGYKLPEGSLIVDPWAVGMGHRATRTLAVEPENFAYRDSLYDKFTINYQSKRDQTLKDVPPNQLGNIKVEQDVETEIVTQKKKSKPRKEKALSQPQSPHQTHQSVRESVVSKPPASYKEYAELWETAFREILESRKLITNKPEQQKIAAIRAVLDDYTKGGNTWWAWFKRVVSFHWNRHHVASVSEIVSQIDDEHYKTADHLLGDLDKLADREQIKSEGTLQDRLHFFKQQAKPTGQQQPRVSDEESEGEQENPSSGR